MKTILFVCSLNTCRSAMAEVIANTVYGDAVAASSAGLCASNGAAMCYEARAALIRAGYDFKSVIKKTSRSLSEKLVADSDIVVGMTADYADALKKRYPKFADKIIAFPIDIFMPSSDDGAGFDALFTSICEGIEKILYPEGGRWGSRS